MKEAETKHRKRVLILGAGESGTGAALLAARQGMEVFVSDRGKLEEKYRNVLLKAGIEFEEGGHNRAHSLVADEVIKSPGIPDEAPLIIRLTEAGIPVISEIEFAARYTRAKKICISGSNGKTTTTTLTHHIMSRGGQDACLAGNVGRSFAWALAEQDHEYFVLEVSSFQLDGMFHFKADTAVLTNITPDHLDRYGGSFERYAASKFRIVNNMDQQGHFVYCADDPVIERFVASADLKARKIPFSIRQAPSGEGAFVKGKEFIISIHQKEFIMSIEALALQGKHNLYNSMAAAIVSKIFDMHNEAIRDSLMDFQGVEHRLEVVAKVHNIEFINDSKATNVNSAWYALESMNRPVVWIVGGLDKGNDYAELKELVKSKVKAIICLGVDNRKLHKEFADLVPVILDTTSMEEAVRLAYSQGKPGDVVLLSPACASFDLFKNYEERGRLFKRAVADL